MRTLHDLAKKQEVWRFFELICSTPHPSGHEELLVRKLKAEAEKAGLQVQLDDFGNMRIDRKAAPGYENAPCVIFQAHLDMVPQKAPGSTFDFLKDPLPVQITGNRIHCGGETTLGADDGTGVALAMALLTAPSLQCGALAAIFTREEEIGLNGARALKKEFLKGKYLLNLDSGCDDCFYAGCAGGVEDYGFFTPQYKPAPAGQGVRIEVLGLEGGHSGADIHLKRGNAHKLLGKLLEHLGASIALASLEGGSVVNAIARESVAVGILTSSLEEAQKKADFYAKELSATFNASEGFGFRFSACEGVAEVWSEKFQRDFLTMLNTLPDGVFEFSRELDSVETSCNVGVIARTSDGKIKVGCHPRSFDDKKWQQVSCSNGEHFKKFGGEFESQGPYPGWKFKSDSRLLEAGQAAAEKIFGKRLPVRAIHAGLEPGIFTPSAPELEMLSFAPAAPNCHTTEEYLDIDSMEKVSCWLRELVKGLQE